MQKHTFATLVVVSALLVTGLIVMPYDGNQQFILSEPRAWLAIALMIPALVFYTVAAIHCYQEERQLEKERSLN